MSDRGREVASSNGRADQCVEDVDRVRDWLLEPPVWATLLLGLPVVAVSVLRARTVGWQPVMYAQIMAACLFMILPLLRLRVSQRTRAWLFVSTLLILGIGGVATWGLIGMGIPTCMFSCVLAVVLLDVQAAAVLTALCTVVIACVGIALRFGLFDLGIDLTTYASAWSAWATAVLGFAVMTGLIIARVNRIRRPLIAAITVLRQRTEQLEWEVCEHRRSEHRYRTLFESADDAIFVMDGAEFIDCNPKTLEMFGCSREEIIGRTPDRFSPDRQPDGRSSKDAAAQLIAAAECSEVAIFEWQHCRADGTPFDVEVNLTRLANGEGAKLLAIVRDITARKRAEEAAAQARSLLLAAFDQTPVGILVADVPDARIRLANAAALGIHGQTTEPLTEIPSELHPEHWEVFSADGAPILREDLPLSRAVLHGETTRNVELLIRRAEGEVCWTIANAAPVRDERGEIAAGVVVLSDITERKQMEWALRDSEERYRLLVSNIPDVTWVSDSEGGTSFISPNVVRVYGYTSQEICAAGEALWFDRIHPDDLQRMREAYETLFSGGGKYDVEYRIRRCDGSWIWLHDRAFTSFEKGGRQIAYGVFSDITVRKELELAEHRQRVLAEALRDTAEILSSTLNLDEVLDRMLDILGTVVEHDRSAVWLADEVAAYPARTSGWEERENLEYLRKLRIGLRDSALVRKLVTADEPLITDDVQQDPDWIAAGIAQRFKAIRANVVVPIRVEGRFLGALSLSRLQGRFTREQVEALAGFANQAAIAIHNANLFETVSRQRAELQRLSARVVEAQEEERRRISRQLHDEVGQNLTALGIDLNIVETQLPKRASALLRDRLADAGSLVSRTTERIRSVMSELRPAVLDDYGLEAALRWYGEQFASRTGVTVSVRGTDPEPRLATAAEIALFRVAQEALTNVARHAKAGSVLLTLELADAALRLIIADDGVGFDPQERRRDERPSWGLSIMAERVQAVGGQLRIDSRPGNGTRVLVEVPR